MTISREAIEEQAEALADEALEGLRIPDALRPAIRAALISEMLATPHGLAMLRRAASDPRVNASGDVARGEVEEDRAKDAVGRKR